MSVVSAARRFGLAGLIVLASTALSDSVVAAEDSVLLSATPDGPELGSLVLTIPDGATSVSTTVFVRNLVKVDLAALSLTGVVDGATITATVLGAPPEGATLKADGPSLAVTITAAATDRAKVVSGRLFAIWAGGSETIATLTVTKGATVNAKVLGAADAGLSLSSSSLVLRYPLVVISDSPDPTSFRFERVALRDATGKQGKVTVTHEGGDLPPDKTVILPAKGSVVLDVVASFEESGDYTGVIRLEFSPSATVIVPLKITVNLLPLSIEFDENAAVRTERAQALGGLVVGYAIHETAGRALELSPPTVTIDRIEADTPGQVEGATCSGTCTATTTLAAYERSQANDTIRGLKEPGKYIVTWSYGGGSGATPKVSVDVFVRDPMGAAAGWIALGFGLSLLIRFLAGNRKLVGTKLELRRLVGEVEALRSAAVDEIQRKVATAVRDDLLRRTRFTSRSNDETVATFTAKVEVLRHYLSVSLDLRQASELGGHAEDLKAIESFLSRDGADKEAAAAAVASILNVQRDVREQMKQLSEIQGLRPSVERRRQQNRPNEATELSKVGDALKAAYDLTCRGKVDDAAASLATAKDLWATLLLDGLETALPEAAPEGLANDWEEQRKRLMESLTRARAQVTVDRRLAAYESLARGAITTLANGLSAAAAGRTKTHPNDTPAMADVAALAKEAEDLARIDLDAAWTKFAEARTIYRLAAKPKKMRGSAPAADTTEATDSTGLEPPIGSARMPGSEPIPSVLPVVATVALYVFMTVVIYAIVAIAGTALGVQTLYAGNLTWGAPIDYLLALLWGLGLYQVGTGAATTIPSLMTSLTSPTP